MGARRNRRSRVAQTRTIRTLPLGSSGINCPRSRTPRGNCKEAFAQAEIAERRIAGGAAPLSWSWLGVTYATCGDNARARHKIDQLHDLQKKQYFDPAAFAEIHCALGVAPVRKGLRGPNAEHGLRGYPSPTLPCARRQ